jgi:hypothetical protein
MKTIKMHTTAAGPGINAHAGQTVQVEDHIANALIAAGCAELVPGPDPEPTPASEPVTEQGEESGAVERASRQAPEDTASHRGKGKARV